MKRIWITLLCIVVAATIFPVPSKAAIFCNMDNIAEASKARILSASGTVSFLQGAATTFEMYSQIELLLAKIGGSFDRVYNFAGVSVRMLKDAARKFGDAVKTGELSVVNKRLALLRDYSPILAKARIVPESPVAKSLVQTSKEQGGAGLLMACQQSVDILVNAQSPTGKIYVDILQRKTLPSDADLWAAMALWTETLMRGSGVSAIFAAAH